VSKPLSHARTDVDDRLLAARQLLQHCRLCERACGVNRLTGETGWCGCDAQSYAYSEGLLWAEEAFITPTYAIFLAGCNLACAFCYASTSNQAPQNCEPVDVPRVASSVRESPTPPATFSFIGGEPAVHLHTALALAGALPPDLPLVWNSNFTFSRECAELLQGCMDVFIADLHFGNDDCAERLAGLTGYLRVVGRNLDWAQGAGSLVVRHLVLPGHVDCCTAPGLAWLAARVPNVRVNILTNYLPPESRLISGMGEYLSEAEGQRARQIAADVGLETVE
jgi:putative pyruvate formate lyase activating enzyme